jgi:hypothetical protein
VRVIWSGQGGWVAESVVVDVAVLGLLHRDILPSSYL